MKISYNWLKELLPDLKLSPLEVAEMLTMYSFEAEIYREYILDPGIKVVKITTLNPHPNADRLRLATVTDGEKEVTVVCGAPNIEVGDVVPYSPPGTKVKDENGDFFAIKEAVIRGEKSPGMLNSLRELGFGSDHGGIFKLPLDTPLGSYLSEHIPDDTVLELDITPNRAHDCLSHLGVAREVAALTGLSVKELELSKLPEADEEVSGFKLDREVMVKTSRYMGIILSDVKNGMSPLWMQARLIAMDSKPISSLVDITNYVMFEIGNPSHAFDIKKMPGKNIGVRNAKDKEKLTLLDGKEYEVEKSEIVITADNELVALAGIMGGKDSEVDDTTTDIFLEVANFHAYTIQNSVFKTGLRSEASVRFLKGIDPNLVAAAGRRLLYLYTQITGGKEMGLLDFYPKIRQEVVIDFNPARVSAVAGTDISSDKSKDVLKKLRMTVDDQQDIWRVKIPTDRLDIEGEHDLVEEVIRVVGLNNIPSAKVDKTPVLLPDKSYFKEVARDLLVSLGLTETYNYSFEPSPMAKLLGFDKEDHLQVVNPISPDQKYMRVSLLPGLLKNFVTNKDKFHKKFSQQEKALFEIGSVFKPGEGGDVRGVQESVNLAGMLVGDIAVGKNILSALLARFNVASDQLTSLSVETLSLPVLKKLKYKMPVTYFELNLNELIKQATKEPRDTLSLEEIKERPLKAKQYLAVSRYPSVFRDISVLVDKNMATEKVREIIERVGGELVADTDLFDEYQPSGSDQKGLAFHIEYQSHDKTLTDEEVSSLHKKIEKALQADLEAALR